MLFLLACSGSQTVVLTDSNNYSLSVGVDLPHIETCAGCELAIDWSGLASDLQCHDIDPAAEINTVGIARFSLTEQELEDALSLNTLTQSQNTGYLGRETVNVTSATTEEMDFFGTKIDFEKEYMPGDGSFMLILQTGTDPGVGARSLSLLAPTPGSKVTSVEVTDACGMLDVDATLTSLASVPVENVDQWTFDWSDLTVDGLGNAFTTAGLDQMMIGHYRTLTVADLEADFLNVEYIADEVYTLSLSGATTAGAELAYSGTTPFPGFTSDGLWVLALRCTRCYNPAPLFLTILDTSAVK